MTQPGENNITEIPTFWNRAIKAAAALEERIANIHQERPCPKCGARVGERCYSLRPSYCCTPSHTKHPHRERYRGLDR